MRIGIVGMATVDTYLRLGSWGHTDESVHLVSGTIRRNGGKGLLTAESARTVGGSPSVSLFAEVGVDGRLLKLLSSRWPQLAPVLDDDSEVWVHISDEGQTTTFVRPGVLAREYAIQHALRVALAYSQLLYLSTERHEVLTAARRLAHESERPYVLNLCEPLLNMLSVEDGVGELTELIRGATGLIMNQHEELHLFALTGVSVWSELFVHGGAPEIVVTTGADGGRILPSDGRDWQTFAAASPRTATISVGAGDTFAGAYLSHRYVFGESAITAAHHASEATSAFLARMNG